MSEEKNVYKKELGRVRGATFTPSVDKDGNLSWSNDDNLANPDTVNIRGPKGADGQPGKNGTSGANGAPGADGKDAPKITNIESSTNGNTITFTFTLSEGDPIVVPTTMPEVKGYLVKGVTTLTTTSTGIRGSVVFKDYNVTPKDNTFTVMLTPVYNKEYEGQLGELYIQAKSTNGFTIQTTGTALINVEWIVFE